jgi:hypothetical protein
MLPFLYVAAFRFGGLLDRLGVDDLLDILRLDMLGSDEAHSTEVNRLELDILGSDFVALRLDTSGLDDLLDMLRSDEELDIDVLLAAIWVGKALKWSNDALLFRRKAPLILCDIWIDCSVVFFNMTVSCLVATTAWRNRAQASSSTIRMNTCW